MSLKAGRVGVAPDQVDEFGKVKSDATTGYTKQEADAKFETQVHAASTYETKADAADLQPKTLEVPIEMLSGTKLTVESALQGLNSELTELGTVQESACTDIISGATAQDNHLYKYGKMVQLVLTITGVTATGYSTVIAKIPEGFRPRGTIDLAVSGDKHIYVASNGDVLARQDMNNNTCLGSATWIKN